MNSETVLSQALSFLGLCKRAGRVTSGTDAVVDAVRGGKAVLALLDDDASENAKKKLGDACTSHGAALYLLPRGTIGHAIGQENRMAAGLPKDGMTVKLQQLLQQYQDLLAESSSDQSGCSQSNQCGGKEVDD